MCRTLRKQHLHEHENKQFRANIRSRANICRIKGAHPEEKETFRFENWWLQHKEVHNLIKNWSSPTRTIDAIGIISIKVRRLWKALRKWEARFLGKAKKHKEVMKMIDDLEQLEKKESSGQRSRRS